MPPVIISSTENLSCADMNNLPLDKSSAKTVAVALDVAPVIVSPLVNFPKDESSKIILSPASDCVLSEVSFAPSNNKLFFRPVSFSKVIPSVFQYL